MRLCKDLKENTLPQTITTQSTPPPRSASCATGFSPTSSTRSLPRMRRRRSALPSVSRSARLTAGPSELLSFCALPAFPFVLGPPFDLGFRADASSRHSFTLSLQDDQHAPPLGASLRLAHRRSPTLPSVNARPLTFTRPRRLPGRAGPRPSARLPTARTTACASLSWTSSAARRRRSRAT